MQSTTSNTSRFPKSSDKGRRNNYRDNKYENQGKSKYYKNNNRSHFNNERDGRFTNKTDDGYTVVGNRRFNKEQNSRFNNKSKDGYTVVGNRRNRNKKNNNSRYYEHKNNNTRITTEVKLVEPKKPVYKEEFPTLGKIPKKQTPKPTILENNSYSVLSKVEDKKTPKTVVKPKGVWGKPISHAEHLKKAQSENLKKLHYEREMKQKKVIEARKEMAQKKYDSVKPISYHSKVHRLNDYNHYYSGSDEGYNTGNHDLSDEYDDYRELGDNEELSDYDEY